jgi:arginase
VWFDAHPDFDTPDEAAGGYFDGMGVATLAGRCWHRLAGTIPGFRPLDLSQLAYCGIRDFEPGQREKVEAHGIRAVYGSSATRVNFADQLDNALAEFPTRALIHLDLDCLDTSVGHANEYAAPGGLCRDDLAACMQRVAANTKPVAMTIASFNPDLAGAAAIAEAGMTEAEIIARAVG